MHRWLLLRLHFCSQGERVAYDGPMQPEDIVLFGLSAYQHVRGAMQSKQGQQGYEHPLVFRLPCDTSSLQ